MAGKSDRDKAIDDLVQQEILADGRDALQNLDKKGRSRRGSSPSGGSGYNGGGGSVNDLDNSPPDPT